MRTCTTLLTAYCCVALCGVALAEDDDKGLLGDVFDTLTLDAKTIEGADGGLGVDVSWKPLDTEGSFGGANIGSGTVAWGYKGNIEYEGMFGTQSADQDNTARAQSLNADIYAVMKPAGDWWLALGGAPASLEADQDFEQVNYVLKPHIYCPIPWTDLLTRHLVYGLFGDNKSAPPIFLKVGYAAVTEIEGEGGRPAEDRFETEVRYDNIQMNALGGAKLNVLYRYYEEDSDSFDFFQVQLTYPIKDGKNLFVQYTTGELPPSLTDSDTVSLGFSVNFGSGQDAEAAN